MTPSCVSFSEDTAEVSFYFCYLFLLNLNFILIVCSSIFYFYVLVGTPAIRKKGSNYKNTVFGMLNLIYIINNFNILARDMNSIRYKTNE